MSKVVKKPHAVSDLESALVHFLQSCGRVSRVDVARRLKLVPSTAGIYVDRLISAGLLTESSGERSAAPTRGRGRPPTLLRLDPTAGRFVGVDFDARQILARAVD